MELKIAEFWEHHFQCRYPSSPVTPYNQNWKRTCTGLEKLSRDGLEFEAQLQYVSDAVMALAYAFRLIVASCSLCSHVSAGYIHVFDANDLRLICNTLRNVLAVEVVA